MNYKNVTPRTSLNTTYVNAHVTELHHTHHHPARHGVYEWGQGFAWACVCVCSHLLAGGRRLLECGNAETVRGSSLLCVSVLWHTGRQANERCVTRSFERLRANLSSSSRWSVALWKHLAGGVTSPFTKVSLDQNSTSHDLTRLSCKKVLKLNNT